MSISDILETIALGASPIGELRVAIPRAIISHDAHWYEAFGWAVLGNLIPVIFLLWWLEPVGKWLEARRNVLGRLLAWRANRLRTTQGPLIQRWGALALAAFVAVPLPLTGAWTGCLVAWAVGMQRPRAFVAIAAGVLVAGAVVAGLVEAGAHFPGVHA